MKHKNVILFNQLFLLFNIEEGLLIKDFSMDYAESIKNRAIKFAEPGERKNLSRWTSLTERKMVEVKQFLLNHGYDVLNSSESTLVINALNTLSKDIATSSKEAFYIYYSPREVCRCGKWHFIVNECAFTKTAINYKDENISFHGGRRNGSGKKRYYTNLYNNETAPLKVPKHQKEEIKCLINWLIDKQYEGNDIKELLVELLPYIKEKSHNEVINKEDNKWEKIYSILSEMTNNIPHFYVREKDSEIDKIVNLK